MPETYDDDTTVDGEPNPVREQREHIKTLEGQLETATRQNTVYRAVPELSDKQIGALISQHEGEWTPDAIKATAVDLGFVQGETPGETTTGPSAEDVAAQQRIAEATAGAGPASPPPTGPAAVKAFRDGLYNTAQGSGALHLSKQQADFERVLSEAGGSVVTGTADVGAFVPQ